MKPADIFLFLIGNRDAIQRVAGSWWSLLIGALLVISAGIARNYDHLDLLRNPEWIYGPFVASGITSIIVFIFVYRTLKLGSIKASGKAYLSFLSIYWMTAPCAWLYGIPVESFTDLITATKWNIAFLAIVSVWRVYLITRSLYVLSGAGIFTSLTAVLLPASAIMCVGSFFKGISLVGIMGGVRLPPHTELLREATGLTCSISFFLTLILGVAWLASYTRPKQTAKSLLPWRATKAPIASLVFVLLIILAALVASIPVQHKVQRNHHLKSLIDNENYREAVDYAAHFNRDDFSKIHYLPPDPYWFSNASKSYHQLFLHMNGTEPKWLRETWSQQYVESMLSIRYSINDKTILQIKNTPGIEYAIREQADPVKHKRLLNNLSNKPQPQPDPNDN